MVHHLVQTALINDPYVVVLGAMGDLHCLDIDSGEVKWHVHLVKDLGGVLPIWGYGWSPLLVDDRLIVMPGGPACSIAARAPESGESYLANRRSTHGLCFAGLGAVERPQADCDLRSSLVGRMGTARRQRGFGRSNRPSPTTSMCPLR